MIQRKDSSLLHRVFGLRPPDKQQVYMIRRKDSCLLPTVQTSRPPRKSSLSCLAQRPVHSSEDNQETMWCTSHSSMTPVCCPLQHSLATVHLSADAHSSTTRLHVWQGVTRRGGGGVQRSLRGETCNQEGGGEGGEGGVVMQTQLALSRVETLRTGGKTVEISAANSSKGCPFFMSLSMAGDSLLLTSW